MLSIVNFGSTDYSVVATPGHPTRQISYKSEQDLMFAVLWSLAAHKEHRSVGGRARQPAEVLADVLPDVGGHVERGHNFPSGFGPPSDDSYAGWRQLLQLSLVRDVRYIVYNRRF